MVEINFVVYGLAKPKGMPRVVRNRFSGKVHAIPPSREWELTFQGQALAHKPDVPLIGAIGFGVLFYRPIPKSFSQKKTLEAVDGRLRPTTKPDIKNLIASAEDALNRIFWVDDAQVVEYIPIHGLYPGKYYTPELPRIEVRILAYEEQPTGKTKKIRRVVKEK